MNSVVMIGRLTGLSEIVMRGKFPYCTGTINVCRDYKVKGEFKYDSFDFRAWGMYAKRMQTAKRGQIIGLKALLERDDEKNIFLNVKGVTFYTNAAAEAIESAMPVLEELHEIGGFAAITDSEVPDF
jgi:hypothetical protein